MSQKKNLIKTLKRVLKSHQLTYRDVSAHLSISEGSVKRIFSSCDFTLDRIEKICELVDMQFSDLVMAMQNEQLMTDALSIENEAALVADISLLLTAHLLINKWTVNQILSVYSIDQFKMTQNLARLDKMKIIDYLPGERVRLKLSRNFKWRDNGPIHAFFSQHVESEFFDCKFDQAGELRLFVSGMLSKAANEEMQRRLKRLAATFDELHKNDEPLALADKYGTSIVLAIRPWDISIFEQLKKPTAIRHFDV